MGIRGSNIARCATCGVHLDLCFCAALPKLRVAPRVVLFVHALEQKRPSNTGSLVAHVLQGTRVIPFGAPGVPASFTPSPSRRQLVLDPAGRTLTAADAARPTELLVADGTWKQARHMMRRLPPLRDAERVSVRADAAATRRLRQSAHPAELSTVEAVAHALAMLGEPAAARALLAAFDEQVQRTLSRRQPQRR